MSFQPQPVYGPPPGYYAAPPAEPRPRTLGAFSMGIALGVFVLSVVASTYVGMSAGSLTHGMASSSASGSHLSSAQLAAFGPVGIVTAAQVIFGTILGILALVLGIVAVATKRGRAFGVVGIAAAAAAPVVSFIVYTTTLAASVPHA
ncbi:hypothetical protein [Leifsonia sp. EB34]|uniref:hypothetical protein n=1 Tax=Leifsonia sp. EB34 TaxID=3156303 RepID=UPI003514AA82